MHSSLLTRRRALGLRGAMANPIDGKNGSHAIVALVVVAEEEVEGTWGGGEVRGEVSRKEPWAAVAFLIDSHAKSLQRMRSYWPLLVLLNTTQIPPPSPPWMNSDTPVAAGKVNSFDMNSFVKISTRVWFSVRQ
jgi:hypothetical protein